MVFLFYFSGEREREKGKKEEKEKKENVFGRNEILDLLRNNRRKRLRNFRALALTDSRTDSPHVFPCLMKEEEFYLMKRKSTMHNSTDESQTRRVSAKRAGIANFPNKTLVFTSLWERSEKRRWTHASPHVFSHLFNSPSRFPLLRQIETRKRL